MDITYLGHSSFRIRGKNATVVTDPYDASTGLKFPKHVESDIVTISHDHADHNSVSQIDGTPFIVNGPGEYEVKGVSVIGVPSFHDDEKGAQRGKNTLYHIELDGVRMTHLGDLGHALTTAEIDALGSVDILFVPIGGTYTIGAEQAASVVAELEPLVVIPMHYQRPELDPKVYGELTGIAEFYKAMGKDVGEPIAKLSIIKDKLPSEMQIVVLS